MYCWESVFGAETAVVVTVVNCPGPVTVVACPVTVDVFVLFGLMSKSAPKPSPTPMTPAAASAPLHFRTLRRETLSAFVKILQRLKANVSCLIGVQYIQNGQARFSSMIECFCLQTPNSMKSRTNSRVVASLSLKKMIFLPNESEETHKRLALQGIAAKDRGERL